MLRPNVITVLAALVKVHDISGYNPTIGELARISGVSYGVANRAMEKLCGLELVASRYSRNRANKAKYRFYPTYAGYRAFEQKGRI